MDLCATGTISCVIRATRDVSVNTTLCTALPYAHVLMHREIDERCSECFRSGEDLLRCTACSTSKYCSRVCQKRAWRYHKIECKGYQRISPKIPKDSMLLLLRLLIKSENKKKEQDEICDVRRTFEDLMSHSEDIEKDSKKCEDFSQLLSGLQVFSSEHFQLPDTRTVFETFGKMAINTFSICDGEMQAIGAGLYLGASGLDHSCSPNSVVTFDGLKLNLRVIQPIRCGQQVTISYMDVLNTTEERRDELLQTYYFLCQCSACNNLERDSRMRTTCCSEIDELSAVTEANSTLQKLKQLKTDADAEGIVEACNSCLQRVRHRGQHKSDAAACRNIHHVRILDALFDAYIQLTRWREAVECGRLLTDMYRFYLPEFHPTVGVHLMKVGKMQLYLQDLSHALETLSQGEKILRVTHSSSHPLYKQLLSLIQQCQQELQALS